MEPAGRTLAGLAMPEKYVFPGIRQFVDQAIAEHNAEFDEQLDHVVLDHVNANKQLNGIGNVLAYLPEADPDSHGFRDAWDQVAQRREALHVALAAADLAIAQVMEHIQPHEAALLNHAACTGPKCKGKEKAKGKAKGKEDPAADSQEPPPQS